MLVFQSIGWNFGLLVALFSRFCFSVLVPMEQMTKFWPKWTMFLLCGNNTAIFHCFVCCRHWRWITSTLSCCQTGAFAGFTWVMVRGLFSNRSLCFGTCSMMDRCCAFLSPPLPMTFLFPRISAKDYLAPISLVLFCAAAATWIRYIRGQGIHFIVIRWLCDVGGYKIAMVSELLQLLYFLCSAPVAIDPCMVVPCSVSWPSTHGWPRVT
jgi:hypothetical protein